MEIIKNFGVDPLLITAQIVNFLIVLYVLKRFLYKPILEVLKKRKDSIEEGLKQAQEARELLEKTAQKEKEILKQARKEVQALLNEAKNQRNEFLEDAEKVAKIKEQKILEEAKKQITFEVGEAQKTLSKEVVGLAIEMLQKSGEELFSEQDQKLVIKNALQRMKDKK